MGPAFRCFGCSRCQPFWHSRACPSPLQRHDGVREGDPPAGTPGVAQAARHVRRQVGARARGAGGRAPAVLAWLLSAAAGVSRRALLLSLEPLSPRLPPGPCPPHTPPPHTHTFFPDPTPCVRAGTWAWWTTCAAPNSLMWWPARWAGLYRLPAPAAGGSGLLRGRELCLGLRQGGRRAVAQHAQAQALQPIPTTASTTRPTNAAGVRRQPLLLQP